jgi:hypothetical protein
MMTGQNGRTQRKICPSATFTTTNPTRPGVPNQCVARDHEVCREIKKKNNKIKIKFLAEILYVYVCICVCVCVYIYIYI